MAPQVLVLFEVQTQKQEREEQAEALEEALAQAVDTAVAGTRFGVEELVVAAVAVDAGKLA